jgi:predicted acetyltransferase
MGGVAGVGVKVTARGGGAASALMRGVVRECADRGTPLSTLYASNQPLYRRAGYEQAGSRFRAKLEASAIPTFHREGFTVEEASVGDLRVRALYEAHGRGRAGALDRADYLWRRIEEPRGSANVRGYVVFDPTGAPCGYVWVRAVKSDTSGWYTVDVTDAVADGPGAWRAVWSVLREHATMGRTLTFSTAPADPLFRAIPHPFAAVELHENWMTRICDPAGALQARGYGVALRARFGLAVVDDLGVASGTWQVSVADGAATVEPGGRPDLTVDVRGLASWFTGFATARDLADRGEIRGDDAAIASADACFAGPLPWMREMF